MSETTFTFRVDDAVKIAFSTAAKAHGRTGAQLLRDFMRDYVKQQRESIEYDAWLRAKVERSRVSADIDNLVPAAEVDTEFAVRRAITRRRLDAAK
ncbi:CopG family ribbon-helix-helix protein [Burkholderia vietnamiensis]|uniref:CopG family ribbon-helix-helix protein n=1 Tax=Burkholderia vietnamiensis TaxID=60552 RepID=UPI001CF27FB2|nr:hypothetical protein [Burkholderia vietnamiensis]MCA8449011.1 hypothetical protein [Burkholderia vietnamiensis]HDR8954372.1 hypothetical protein [Burkholderia vietnamiensis]